MRCPEPAGELYPLSQIYLSDKDSVDKKTLADRRGYAINLISLLSLGLL
jgi:hypothetical protein